MLGCWPLRWWYAPSIFHLWLRAAIVSLIVIEVYKSTCVCQECWPSFRLQSLKMRRISSLLLLLTLRSRTPAPCEAPTLPVPSVSIIEERRQTTADRLKSQWDKPNDVLTILLIIGGDIVQKALA